MKHAYLVIPTATCLLLVGCYKDNTVSIDTDLLLQNPLYAERYSEEIVQSLVELQIQEDPILEDEKMKVVIDENRREWLKIAKQARADQRNEAMLGHFIGATEYVKGEVLYAKDKLHFDTIFTTTPGINLHVFLTTAVDPRDIEFPDDTALDLGSLQSPYGAQTYTVPPQSDPLAYRTAVLWDSTLNKVYSFAQLSVQ